MAQPEVNFAFMGLKDMSMDSRYGPAFDLIGEQPGPIEFPGDETAAKFHNIAPVSLTKAYSHKEIGRAQPIRQEKK